MRDSEKRIGIPQNGLRTDKFYSRIKESPIGAMKLPIGDLFRGIEMH